MALEEVDHTDKAVPYLSTLCGEERDMETDKDESGRLAMVTDRQGEGETVAARDWEPLGNQDSHQALDEGSYQLGERDSTR